MYNDKKTTCKSSPALWLIFAAPFGVILLRKVPVNNDLALITTVDMGSGCNNKYLLKNPLASNKKKLNTKMCFLLSHSLQPHPICHVPVCSYFLSSPAKLNTPPDVGLQSGSHHG